MKNKNQKNRLIKITALAFVMSIAMVNFGSVALAADSEAPPSLMIPMAPSEPEPSPPQDSGTGSSSQDSGTLPVSQPVASSQPSSSSSKTTGGASIPKTGPEMMYLVLPSLMLGASYNIYRKINK